MTYGLDGVDLEIDGNRWLAEKRSRPTGTAKFGATTSQFVVWRGPATVDDAGRIGFFCFEGGMQGTIAKAASAYRVTAEPIVPGVWAFRSGRPDSPYARDLGQGGQSPLTPDPCIGTERVEFIGPPAFWIVGSSIDPRDTIAIECNVDGGCPFARVAVPLEEGSLSSALLMSDDPGQLERLTAGPKPANLTRFGGAPSGANVFGYTFELDWSQPGEGPFGHLLIAASAVPVSKLGPRGTRGRY